MNLVSLCLLALGADMSNARHVQLRSDLFTFLSRSRISSLRANTTQHAVLAAPRALHSN